MILILISIILLITPMFAFKITQKSYRKIKQNQWEMKPIVLLNNKISIRTIIISLLMAIVLIIPLFIFA